MKRIFQIFIFCCLTLFPRLSQGQGSTDSYVRLISADRAQLLEIDGKPFRKVEGSAEFFHNNTRLLCDTAFWNVEEEFIDARGNVKIIQENTILTGDSLHYRANKNTAEFRGSLVQLIDRDNNILRTNHLDYNLKDSVAFFYYGASMRDTEGNIIESERGIFSSKISNFTFIDNVQMFSDSLFFVSDTLIFLSDINTAFFGTNTKAWKDDNYLSSNGGWYDQGNDKIFFEDSVYAQTIDYEVWSETLFYDRISINSKLENDIQILDTINNALILGDQLIYEHSSKYTEITKKPVMVGIAEENGVIDSLFMTADTILYYTVKMSDIDDATIAQAYDRKKLAQIDVFESARANMEKTSTPPASTTPAGAPTPSSLGSPTDTTQTSLVDTTEDLLANRSQQDSMLTTFSEVLPTDSLDILVQSPLDTMPKIILPDTTEVKFIEAYHRVKIFKSDFQVLCDSLIYTEIDSIARLYDDPVLWNEITNQLTADSLQFFMENGTLTKAYLLSNAFVIAEDTPTYYNQIRSPEMVGYFNDGELYRYDAMGGVSSIFYLEQDSVINTVLVRETKVMSTRLKDGGVERVYNLESPKTDAYPLYDLPLVDQRLKGFLLRDAERPANRDSITTRKIRKSIRAQILNAPTFPVFNSTAEYFPTYMHYIFLEINQRSPLKWKKIDSSHVNTFQEVDVLIDREAEILKRDFEGREISPSVPIKESVSNTEQEEVITDVKELKEDRVETEETPTQKELSEKKAELKDQSRQKRVDRKVERRKKAIAKKLQKEEEKSKK